MRKGILAVTVVGALALAGVAACGNSKSSNASNSGTTTGAAAGKAPFVGVILPDTKSSARYETQDLPNLTAAFKSAGVKATIQNAQGDSTQFQTIADTMLSEGVNVLVIDSLDSASGTAVISKAHNQGVPVVDYDRLTAGGGADFYVSFNNMTVGKLQGQGLGTCIKDDKTVKPTIAELNGAPTDNNATQFAQGYNAILNPLYANGTYVKGPNQSVPDWDNTQAGTIFEQMLASTPQIKGVLVANDGMANSVIAVLSKNHLTLPVTGQDATVQGLQHIMDGTQCMTVFKDTKIEANAAANLAVQLAKGQKPSTTQTTLDPTTHKQVPSVLETPEAIFVNNINDVVKAGGTTIGALCTGVYVQKCAADGVTGR
jgi:D-xylose transport system substrate-binding protein